MRVAFPATRRALAAPLRSLTADADPIRGPRFASGLRSSLPFVFRRFLPEREAERRAGVDPSSRVDSSASKVVGQEIVHATPWLQFKHLSYLDPTGRTRSWDMVGRATKKPGAVADAVCVLATLKKKGEPDDVLLVRQFRPPMGGETIELPAGLVDEHERAEHTALRELEEETGYVGKVAGSIPVTPGLPLSPGLSDETVRLVRVVVDLDDAANTAPKQKLEGSEFITVMRVRKRGLRRTLDELANQGYHVFAGLYTLALGMELGEDDEV